MRIDESSLLGYPQILLFLAFTRISFSRPFCACQRQAYICRKANTKRSDRVECIFSYGTNSDIRYTRCAHFVGLLRYDMRVYQHCSVYSSVGLRFIVIPTKCR